MICYKCDMCLKVHDSVGEMTNLVFSHAGTSSVNFPKNGKFHLCNECKSKLLNNLHAFATDGFSIQEERLQGECKTCRHRDPEDKKCDCGGLERLGCEFPVSDDYFCKFYEKGGVE